MAAVSMTLSTPSIAEPELQAFEFALIGDYPYFPSEYEGMPHLLRDIREDLALRFVIHLGDIHNPGFTDCSEALFRERFEMLSRLGHPFPERGKKAPFRAWLSY